VACLSDQELSLVARARDPINTGGVERNRLLFQIVCAYRAGPRSLWGPVILDLLAPTLILMLQSLRPEPPGIDEEEIRQQLVAETLRSAETVPLLESGLQTRFRITSRTYTRLLRWLAREGRRQRRQVPFDSCKELPR
ncbi:MAG TPA: hypothetical protein VHO95_05360, partial [Candidatus Dormibacteraeota bacterium]|jgi:hypothetical protein|nr:hypothetical protein [Candidatus Dormibacteraeota bacterium]